jgi:DNA processing protein
VALVGTRSATHYGRQVASELGAELADHGVTTVSGLALGIDAAAHAGVVQGTDQRSAPPVAVVGTGLDVVYPVANQRLWEEVARRGAVLAESPLGTRPRPGVFPARNRIIAALSDVVVVVECHLRGGALYTAEAAARRSIPVCAVPGSVRSRSSAGTNALLVDGCTPVRDTADVLAAVSLACPGPSTASFPPIEPTTRVGRPARRRHRPASPTESAVLAAVDDHPTPMETILLRTGCPVGEVASACDHLVQEGALVAGAGWWSLA